MVSLLLKNAPFSLCVEKVQGRGGENEGLVRGAVRHPRDGEGEDQPAEHQCGEQSPRVGLMCSHAIGAPRQQRSVSSPKP